MSVAAAVGHDLRRETEAAKLLLSTYRDILGDDAEARADMVEGETDLLETIRRGLVRIAELDAMCAGLKTLATQIDARKHRLDEQAKTLRSLLLVGMEAAGKRKIETDIATVSCTRVPASVVVKAEAEIPARFWKRGDPKLDKKALLDALKSAHEAGEKIPGAELSNGGETVSIRFA